MPAKEEKSDALQGHNIWPHPQFKRGSLQLIHKDILISAWLCIIKTSGIIMTLYVASIFECLICV